MGKVEERVKRSMEEKRVANLKAQDVQLMESLYERLGIKVDTFRDTRLMLLPLIEQLVKRVEELEEKLNDKG